MYYYEQLGYIILYIQVFPNFFRYRTCLILRAIFSHSLWDWINIHSNWAANSMWDSIKCIRCALSLTEVTNHHWNSTAQQDALCQGLVPQTTPVSGINPSLVLFCFFGFVVYEINTEPEIHSNTLSDKPVKDQKQGTRNWLVHLKKTTTFIKSRSACRVTWHQFPVWNLHIEDTEDNSTNKWMQRSADALALLANIISCLMNSATWGSLYRPRLSLPGLLSQCLSALFSSATVY